MLLFLLSSITKPDENFPAKTVKPNQKKKTISGSNTSPEPTGQFNPTPENSD